MVDQEKQATQDTLFCSDCHTEMNPLRPKQSNDAALPPTPHFFQCPNCSRVQESLLHSDIIGVPSDPSLPLAAR